MLIREPDTDRRPLSEKVMKRDIKRPTNLLLPAFARITGLSSSLALVVRDLGSRHGGEGKGDNENCRDKGPNGLFERLSGDPPSGSRVGTRSPPDH